MMNKFTLRTVLFTLMTFVINAISAQTSIVCGFRNRLENITSTKEITDSAMGVGTQSPDGKMEVLYCPPFG
jgi:hypothetical protein